VKFVTVEKDAEVEVTVGKTEGVYVAVPRGMVNTVVEDMVGVADAIVPVVNGDMAVPDPDAPRATVIVGPVARPCVDGNPIVAVAVDADSGVTTKDDIAGETGW
jgi:hypothetical protein